MEDAQPNEVRLSRKGSISIPRVRTTRPVYTPYRRPAYPRRPSSPHDPRPSKRIRWHSPPTRAPLPSIQNDMTEDTVGHELVLVEVHLPRECCRETPGCRNARKRWIEDQKRYLKTSRYHSVVSFEYLDDKRRVLFTCRTREAAQSTGHHTKDNIAAGSHPVNAPLDTESINATRQDAVAPSMVKARDNHGDLAQVIRVPSISEIWLNSPQSREPGPSHVRLAPRALAGLRDRPQRLDDQPFVPSSSFLVESKLVESSTTEMKSHPVQTAHTNAFPRHRVTMHTVSPTNSIIDSYLDPHSSVAEEHSTRWLTFRSGCVDIALPSLSSGSRGSSPETGRNPRPSINQTLVQVMGQPEHMPVDRRNDSNPHSAITNVRASDAVSVRSTTDHRTSESCTDQLRQRDVLEATRSSHPRDYSILLEGEGGVLPSPHDYSPPPRNFSSACDIVPLPLGPYDRPRRMLYNDGFTYVVTAHGLIDQVDATGVLKWDCNIRSPSSPFEAFVDDACILPCQGEPVIILGHAREKNQISLLNLGHSQVSRHIALHRDWNTTKKFGASAVTSLMSSLKFASGGYDHRVHIWDIAQDLSGASAVALAIKHNSTVHSLLPILDSSHKLVSVGADRDVRIYDLSAERVVQTLKVSCIPYHAYKIDSVSCTLLEVSHLETQYEVHDHRVPNRAVERFGFLTEERRGRYDKADTWSHFVACGDRNGAVHFWDLRNVSKEVATRQRFNDPVTQVVHTGSRLLACSRRNELAYIDFQGGSNSES